MTATFHGRFGAGRALQAVLGPVVAVFAALLVVRLGDVDNIVKFTLLLVLVGVGLVILRRPDRLLALLVVAAPFDYAVTLIGFEVTTNDILLFSVAILLVPHLKVAALPGWVKFGAGSIVVGTGAAALLAERAATAAYGSFRYTAAVVILLAAVVVMRSKPQAAVVRFGLLLSLAAPAVLLGAVLQRAGVVAPPLGPAFSSDRLDSTFGYYTQYAGFMAVVLVLAVGGVIDAVARGQRRDVLIFAAGGAAAAAGLGLSLSRGALAGAAAGLAVVVLLHLRRPSSLVGVVSLVAVLVAGAWAVTPAEYRAEIQERLTTRQGGDNTRAVLQSAGLDAMTGSPLGMGFGNFPEYLERNDRSPEVGLPFFHAHRTPLQIALDTGWLGLVGFAVLLGGALLGALARWRDGTLGSYGIGVVGAVSVFLVQGWNDYLLYETAFVTLVFCLLWATLACGQQKRASTTEGVAV